MIFDDATCAVKACIEHGITLGGQVSISDLINNTKEGLITDIISRLNKPGSVKNIGINLTEKHLKNIISDILGLIKVSSKAAFTAVFENATNNKWWIYKTFNSFSGELNYSKIIPVPTVKTYNLIKNEFEQINYNSDGTINTVSVPDLIVPGNTDVECLKSVFSILSLFLTSNQLISVMVREDK